MKNAVHLGSWGLYCDLSGRVRETVDNPVVTIAAVAISVDVTRPLRTRVRRALPGENAKWKYGELAGLRKVADLISTFQIQVAIDQLHIADRARWRRYFEEGKRFLQEASEPIPFAEPGMTLRMRLLGGAVATLSGRVMRSRYRDEVEESTIQIKIVVDTDFRDTETEEQFRESFFAWAPKSRLRVELGIQPSVQDVRCETEQNEPLLLLPDYLAGLYHHADPRAVLGQPVVTQEEAAKAVEELRTRLGNLMYKHQHDFVEQYPLAHEKGRVVLKRPYRDEQK